jgi:hypothetical protein
MLGLKAALLAFVVAFKLLTGLDTPLLPWGASVAEAEAVHDILASLMDMVDVGAIDDAARAIVGGGGVSEKELDAAGLKMKTWGNRSRAMEDDSDDDSGEEGNAPERAALRAKGNAHYTAKE